MPLIRLYPPGRRSITGLQRWTNFYLNATDWATTAFATFNMMRFVANRFAQFGRSTNFSAGHCRTKRSRTCAPLLPDKLGDNPQTTDMICRNLVLVRTECSPCSRRIASVLAYPQLTHEPATRRLLYMIERHHQGMSFEVLCVIHADHPSLPGQTWMIGVDHTENLKTHALVLPLDHVKQPTSCWLVSQLRIGQNACNTARTRRALRPH